MLAFSGALGREQRQDFPLHHLALRVARQARNRDVRRGAFNDRAALANCRRSATAVPESGFNWTNAAAPATDRCRSPWRPGCPYRAGGTPGRSSGDEIRLEVLVAQIEETGIA